MRKASRLIAFLAVLVLPFAAAASAEAGMAERETALVIQIGVILFAVRIGAALATRIGVPTVLGELLAGVVIGPYVLGALPLPGFPSGLFAGSMGELAVSPELYGIATIASTKRSSSAFGSLSVGSTISVPATGQDIVGAW